MKKIYTYASLLFVIALLAQCTGNKASDEAAIDKPFTGEFNSQVEWGEHLVVIGACHDCHTPKKMTPLGPVLDTALWLSGYPASRPKIDLAYEDIGAKGYALTTDLTEWLGPWGTTYTANLTPHATGTGSWTEESFMRALREGKFKGLQGARSLLPPMPWEMYKHMTDAEIKAIFAYLRTIKPIDNIVPQPIPPGG
jgi:mono/diheme cytochrome c family protein